LATTWFARVCGSPLRWMKGPKITPYNRLPKRIDHAHMEALWRAAANRGGDYSSHLWVTVLAMLYGTDCDVVNWRG
jgi:hypothetical protein